MRTLWKMASIMLALGAVATLPACAQTTYGDGYYGNDSPSGYPPSAYDDGYYGGGVGYYGSDAYGYCDAFGCPADYWSLPLYYGSIYYDGAWIGGPLYYRNWGGQRQYWIRGGWRHDGWRGTRPSRYRAGYTGPALGLNWYRSHQVYRRDFRANTYRDSYGQTRHYGYGGQQNSNRYGNRDHRYGYGGQQNSNRGNRYRDSFTGQANRGEFRRPSQNSGPRNSGAQSRGHNSGASTPWRGNRMGHSAGGNRAGGGDRTGGSNRGGQGNGYRR